jgi:hypothetical protein
MHPHQNSPMMPIIEHQDQLDKIRDIDLRGKVLGVKEVVYTCAGPEDIEKLSSLSHSPGFVKAGNSESLKN